MHKLDPKAVWLFFVNALFGWLLFFILVGWWFPFAVRDLDISVENLFPDNFWIWLILMVVILAVLAYIVARLSYHFYKYELSELGFKKEYGIIWKKYVTIPYDRIQNVDIYRGVWARILGLSDLQIQTAGMSYVGKRGVGTEGRLPGISRETAEYLRDELIKRSRQARTGQGL